MHNALAGGVAALALVAAGCSGEAATADRLPAPAPTPVVAVTTAPTPTPTPTPTPQPTVDPDEARLEALRASDAFEALAEHDRAATAEWSRFAWESFGLSRDAAGDRAEWSNKAELWDEVMLPIRDSCLLAGDEASRTMWDGKLMIPIEITPRWNDASTGGRGQFLEVACVYQNDDHVAERWFGVLIATDNAMRGAIRRRMNPFDFFEDEADTYAEREERVPPRLWAWITEEPRP